MRHLDRSGFPSSVTRTICSECCAAMQICEPAKVKHDADSLPRSISMRCGYKTQRAFAPPILRFVITGHEFQYSCSSPTLSQHNIVSFSSCLGPSLWDSRDGKGSSLRRSVSGLREWRKPMQLLSAAHWPTWPQYFPLIKLHCSLAPPVDHENTYDQTRLRAPTQI